MRDIEEVGTRRHKDGRGLAQVPKAWGVVFLFSPLFAGYYWPELPRWEMPQLSFPLLPFNMTRVDSDIAQ